MKLYYSPFACSLASHIACREAGLDVELVRVELATKMTERGGDLFEENAMGQVPTLVLDEGRVLTENVAVLSYLGDRMSGGEEDRYELVRWLSFVATELHKKVLAPIFAPTTPEPVKVHARASVDLALRVADTRLADRETLLGSQFTTADAYLFWALTLMPHAGISLEPFPSLRAYHERHRERPAVRAALAFEKKEREVPFAPKGKRGVA
ncbi:MAG: glutathione S-transferase family protein [Deltaproteobacteria bacterium]|nr:glutathione S-transferase family protein [Deltaproteobacteria bacterium]